MYLQKASIARSHDTTNIYPDRLIQYQSRIRLEIPLKQLGLQIASNMCRLLSAVSLLLRFPFSSPLLGRFGRLQFFLREAKPRCWQRRKRNIIPDTAYPNADRAHENPA